MKDLIEVGINRISYDIHSFFYKNKLHKNTKAGFNLKIRTFLEHAQPQMRELSKAMNCLQSVGKQVLMWLSISISICN